MRVKQETGEEWPGPVTAFPDATMAVEGSNSELPPDVIQYRPSPLSSRACGAETGYHQGPLAPSHV